MPCNQNRESLTFIRVVVLLIALVASKTSVCLAQEEKSGNLNRSFLEERRSPLKEVRAGGVVVVVRNVSEKQILTWDEMCLARSGDGYKILEVFTLNMKSPLKPGEERGDSFNIDGSPMVVCRAYGGKLAISEVQFEDGSSWKSRWLKTTLPKVLPNQK